MSIILFKNDTLFMKTLIIPLFVFSSLLSLGQVFNTYDMNEDTIAIHVSPNPFITTCQIEFEIEELDTFNLGVYNLWGQADTIYLEDSLLNPGQYSFEYITENNGLYIIMLGVNGEYFSKKIVKTNSSTSIQIKNEIENIKLSPNPANQIVKVEFPDHLERDIKILNATGQLMEHIQKHNENSLLLNIESYPKGIYYISVSGHKTQTTKTLIID